MEGFRLDRGFQVYLTAYPEGQERLDYASLGLRSFYPGSLVRADGAFHRIGDPWRRPLDMASTLAARVGSLVDKARIGKLRLDVQSGTLEELFQRPEVTTAARLVEYGFSDAIIERFFRPFFGGVFFDPELQTSSRQFEFCFRMFSAGKTALPEEGMEAIPRQLAARLPAEAIRLNTAVSSLQEGGVLLEGGERLEAASIVLATEATAAARLLGDNPPPRGQSATTLYFSAPQPPITQPILVLDGERSGPVNHLAVPSLVAPTYAPAGRHLVCANLLGLPPAPDAEVEAAVRRQLSGWFGPSVNAWRHLRTYRIPYALPENRPPALEPHHKTARARPGIYLCGDWRADASINGAMVSGRLAAEALLADTQ